LAREVPASDKPQKAAEHILDPWLLSVALVWGLNAVANKWCLTVMGPAGILLFRYVGCVLVVPAAAYVIHRRNGGALERPWGAMILTGLWVSAQQLTFIHALDWTTASEAALIISVAPIWTALIGAAIGLEVVSAANWAGILAAVCGVGMIVLGGTDLDANIPTRLRGDIWMLVSSLLYGSFMVYSKGTMKRYGSIRVLSWAFLWGTLLVVPAGFNQLVGADWAQFTPTLWGALIFSAFVSGGYGFIVWYRTIDRTTPARTAVYQYLVPVVALTGAALLLGERLALVQIIGSAVVITGLVLARRAAPAGPRGQRA